MDDVALLLLVQLLVFRGLSVHSGEDPASKVVEFLEFLADVVNFVVDPLHAVESVLDRDVHEVADVNVLSAASLHHRLDISQVGLSDRYILVSGVRAAGALEEPRLVLRKRFASVGQIQLISRRKRPEVQDRLR